jgi:Na+/H+ antiporter NhaD/arsenite permease-like protein
MVILFIFILSYLFIILEHNIKIDKAASALVGGVLCWTALTFQQPNELVAHSLTEHIVEISSILLFLMGAMTIVEIIDAHHGFEIITNKISTTSKFKLLWIISFLAFFLSAALDNLTTAIVMVSLIRKIISDQKTRWIFGGIVVIAANAGGAWSPIGDVTTTMLWIGGQITTGATIQSLFLPSLISVLIPLIILSFIQKGNVQPTEETHYSSFQLSKKTQWSVFLIGVGGLLFVPIFKTITHLPPFMGMMLSVGITWFVIDLVHGRKIGEERAQFSALSALRKIDLPSVLFFLGILLSVGALQQAGFLEQLSAWLKDTIQNGYGINVAIGFLSAIIDNVPLVAASKSMYPIVASGTSDAWMNQFVQDGSFWQFLAYTAGTGGSMLIIGSAAGVAVMGIEKIPFSWYLKHLSWLAVIGFLAGCAVFLMLHS